MVVFAQNGANKKAYAVHADALRPHNAQAEDLFAQGLAVAQRQRNEKFKNQGGQQQADGKNRQCQPHHHFIGVGRLLVLAQGLLRLRQALGFLLAQLLEFGDGQLIFHAVLRRVIIAPGLKRFDLPVVAHCGGKRKGKQRRRDSQQNKIE